MVEEVTEYSIISARGKACPDLFWWRYWTLTRRVYLQPPLNVHLEAIWTPRESPPPVGDLLGHWSQAAVLNEARSRNGRWEVSCWVDEPHGTLRWSFYLLCPLRIFKMPGWTRQTSWRRWHHPFWEKEHWVWRLANWTSCLGCPCFSCRACSALVYGAGSYVNALARCSALGNLICPSSTWAA